MSGRTRAGVAAGVAAYGLVMIVANARNGLLPNSFTRDWVLFGGGTDFPGDFGRNVFGGSVGLGVVLLLLAGAVVVTAGRAAARAVGAVAVTFGLVLVVLYDDGGNVLAAKPAGAAVFAAAGLFLLASPLARGPAEEAKSNAVADPVSEAP